MADDAVKQRSLRQHLLVFLKGMAMGAADSIPGVSGGTIAFIANIYDELLGSIRSVTPRTALLLFREGPRAAWNAVNGNFLLVLGCGILLALVLSANLVVWLLEYHYSYLMAFFNGLILASLPFVAVRMPQFRAWYLLLMLAGAAASVALSQLPQLPGSTSLGYYFFSGAVAICAMILPGISGAFILLLLGAYQPVLSALTTLDWTVIIIFASGCALGLLSFSHLLYWLLQRARSATLAFLLGVLAGSLYALWPWRRAVSEAATGEGGALLRQQNLAPMAADIHTGAPLSWWLLALLVLAGIMLVTGLEWAGSKFNDKSSSSGQNPTNSL